MSNTTTVQQSTMPEWARPQLEALFGAATDQIFNTTRGVDAQGNPTYTIDGLRGGFAPFNTSRTNMADAESAVAGFSPLQRQSFEGAANLRMPSRQFDNATTALEQAGLGAFNSANVAYDYGNKGYQSGQMGQQLGLQGLQDAQLRANVAQNAAYGYGGQGAQYGQNAANIGQMALQAQDYGRGIGNQAQNYAAQAANAGQLYQQQATNPSYMSTYMSPYMQNVIQAQMQEAQRSADIAAQSRDAGFAKAGAFGGARQGIENAQAAKNLALLKNSIQSSGLQNAFQNAQQSHQFGANLGLQGLQGAQQGLGTALQGGQLGLSGIGQAIAGQQAGMQGAQTGLQGVGQAINAGQLAQQGYGTGLAGTAQGMQGAQVGLQGVSGAQAGYAGAANAATRLADVGTQQLGAQQSILDMQNRFGAQQQGRDQRILDQAMLNYGNTQNYPMQQLGQFSNLIRGYATPGTTTSTNSPSPSIVSQLGGAGLAAYGLLRNKRGGRIKAPKATKSGGLSDLLLSKIK